MPRHPTERYNACPLCGYRGMFKVLEDRLDGLFHIFVLKCKGCGGLKSISLVNKAEVIRRILKAVR